MSPVNSGKKEVLYKDVVYMNLFCSKKLAKGLKNIFGKRY